MKHKWKHIWKEHRGFFVSVCQECGFGMAVGLFTFYMLPDEVTRFLTTYKPIVGCEYRHCEI